MRPLLTLLSLLSVLLSSQVARADPADIAATSRAVVRIVLIADDGGRPMLIGHGSGVAIAPDLVLTNAHVVSPDEAFGPVRIAVVPPQGRGGFARPVAVSPGNDLALLRFEGRGALAVGTLFTGAVADGSDVFAVGYPGSVDLAQGLGAIDLVSPTSPVKTRGSVSSGRSSRQFDTLLHTAPIASGNSGGPLLDVCGRVVGINSFGTDAMTGADSEFYFAVSIREIARFLLSAGVKARTTGVPCRSFADLERAEAERMAGEQARTADAARAATERRAAAGSDALRRAQFEVIAARENRMALAGLALLLAVVAGGAGWMAAQKGRTRDSRVAWGAAAVLATGAVAAWLTRPSLDAIDARAKEIEAAAAPSGAPRPGAAEVQASGALTCVIDQSRSRITVSDIADVPLGWTTGGCVNGRTQYGRAPDGGWLRVLLPAGEDTASLARFDPSTGEYRVDRWYLDAAEAIRLRADREALAAPACGTTLEAAEQFGAAQSALSGRLPPQPNERLVFRCTPAPSTP